MSNPESNLLFVKEVEKYEVLYNYTLPGYSRKDVREEAWQEVADKVNLSAAECKEKWRNLRTVYMRKMKPVPRGSRRKTYYLAEAMDFCSPFIKSLAPSIAGNLLQVPKNEPIDEIIDDTERYGDSVSQEDPLYNGQFSEPPSPNSLASPERTVLSQQSMQVIPVNPFSTWAKRKRGNSSADEDHYTTEYFKAKRSMLKTNVNEESTNFSNDRKEALKMFLLSLMPELEELSDSQIKLFKRRVFNLIDEVSTTSQGSFIAPLSPNSSSSHISGLSHENS